MVSGLALKRPGGSLELSSYDEFIKSKAISDQPSGFDWPENCLTNGGSRELFPFQKAIVKWALKRGRAAIFANTGMGKTAMQLSWAYSVWQFTGNRVLILAPLCVANQTVAEGEYFGIPVKYVRSPDDAKETGIYIVNYEMVDHFQSLIERGWFDGIVLDESSVIKNQDGKTRARITAMASNIPFRLSCTATPSPNDYMELGTQAEFLGVMGMTQMLSTFFIHDSGETSKWRLKGHGRKKFWEWLATWAVCIQKPSDLGFDDTGYDLPPLEIEELIVSTPGMKRAETLSERNSARRETIDMRVEAASNIANAIDDSVLVWCNLNDESAKLKESIEGSVEVKGSDKVSDKEDRLMGFSEGRYRKLVSKATIAGFGLNWQHCNRMIFVGLNDSYEQLYQAIRRCYRFGQKRPVKVTLITADCEGAVLENIKRKESQHQEMMRELVDHMKDFTRREVVELKREKDDYTPSIDMALPGWIAA